MAMQIEPHFDYVDDEILFTLNTKGSSPDTVNLPMTITLPPKYASNQPVVLTLVKFATIIDPTASPPAWLNVTAATWNEIQIQCTSATPSFNQNGIATNQLEIQPISAVGAISNGTYNCYYFILPNTYVGVPSPAEFITQSPNFIISLAWRNIFN